MIGVKPRACRRAIGDKTKHLGGGMRYNLRLRAYVQRLEQIHRLPDTEQKVALRALPPYRGRGHGRSRLQTVRPRSWQDRSKYPRRVT
jgi:hypothetical protein